MEKENITVREASILVWVSDKTIRKMLNSGKIHGRLGREGWKVTKTSLLSQYPIQEQNIIGGGITEGTEVTNQKNIQTPDITVIIQPLMDRIAYYDNELNNTRRLLDSSREEKEQVKEREIKLIAQSKEKEENIIKKYTRRERIFIYSITALVLAMVLMYLISKSILVVHI